MALSKPLGNSAMTVRNKGFYLLTSRKQVTKTTLATFKFHVVADASCLICLNSIKSEQR